MNVSEYDYERIMDQCVYDYETKGVTIPGSCFIGMEHDSLLQFASKQAASDFVYKKLRDEWIFTYKNKKYFIRVIPDIVVHGGMYGPGTWVTISRMENNTIIPCSKGYQGKYSTTRVAAIISKHFI